MTRIDLRSAWLFEAIVLWSLVGYPLLAALTTTFGGNNTLVSATGRGMVALAALLLLSRSRLTGNWVLVLFIGFWLAYVLRLLVSLHIFAEPLSRSAPTYWIWAIGACFLPGLAALVAFNPVTALRWPRALLVLSLVTIALFLLTGGTQFMRPDGTVSDISRWNVGSLNPISMGHLGVTACLLGASVLAMRGQDRLTRALALAAIGGGGIITLLANSRGPFVALAAGFALLLLARAGHRRALWMGIAATTGALYLVLSAPDLLTGDTGVLARFRAISEGTDMSAMGRYVSFTGAVDQFLGAPLFGDGLEERNTGFYPHNVILEAFMATGILGGLPFALLMLGVVGAAWRLARMGSVFAWMGVLAVQYVVAAQFSGAIYQSPTMWVMAMLTFAAHRDQCRRRRLARRAQRRFARAGLPPGRFRPTAPAPQGDISGGPDSPGRFANKGPGLHA